MRYQEKLKSPKWQKKRLKILERDNFKCKWCHDGESQLQIHHIKYSGNHPADCPDEDLITICNKCHQFYEDQKKIWGNFEVDKILIIDTNEHGCQLRLFKEINNKIIHLRIYLADDPFFTLKLGKNSTNSLIKFLNG